MHSGLYCFCVRPRSQTHMNKGLDVSAALLSPRQRHLALGEFQVVCSWVGTSQEEWSKPHMAAVSSEAESPRCEASERPPPARGPLLWVILRREAGGAEAGEGGPWRAVEGEGSPPVAYVCLGGGSWFGLKTVTLIFLWCHRGFSKPWP